MRDGFVWGVSTASYQIEGAVDEDGRGRSIWDTFAHEPGRVVTGETGDVACDHYHRYAEDVDLIANLGVDAYRFSVAWPRVQPDGKGPANEAGLAFYDRLVDTLLAKGVDPVVTLFHWDLPQALQDDGGWFNRDTAYRFAEYADLVAARLGDRVGMWITLNEPFVHTVFGHAFGVHAPGQTLMFDALPTAHHQLLGHGLAVAALRGRTSAPVTLANNYSPVVVLGDTEADHRAGAAYDALHNRLFTDPLTGRGYPEGFDLPVRDGDLEIIAAPLDALGVNYYNPTGVRAPGDPDGGLPFDIVALEGYPVTDFDWPVVPEGLRQLLGRLHADYGLPMYVTESGCAYAESPNDQRRIDYLAGHIGAVSAARSQGVDVRGYFVWSILDNFEWAEGYSKRFGLVHVDFTTLVRTPKASYAWLREHIAAHR
ncbi:GH1 family beta-glucosidase [Luedemannella flava]|uniref:Beta-glucosidase n=1 Tax=Luedemannella flava TaxID=349316 RepID=A0ABN2MR01_9ACTN